jgi:hypothetical protein
MYAYLHIWIHIYIKTAYISIHVRMMMYVYVVTYIYTYITMQPRAGRLQRTALFYVLSARSLRALFSARTPGRGLRRGGDDQLVMPWSWEENIYPLVI